MRAKEIKNLAEDLRENYNTRNPFELADKFGIKVLGACTSSFRCGQQFRSYK